MNDTGETITAQNTTVTGCRHNCSRLPWLRRRERQRSMGPVPVVVIDEDLKNPLKVLLVQDQQPIETLRTGCAHEPLGNPIRLWRAKRGTNDFNVVASEDVVKTRGEFLIPIANQESDWFRALRQRPR